LFTLFAIFVQLPINRKEITEHRRSWAVELGFEPAEKAWKNSGRSEIGGLSMAGRSSWPGSFALWENKPNDFVQQGQNDAQVLPAEIKSRRRRALAMRKNPAPADRQIHRVPIRPRLKRFAPRRGCAAHRREHLCRFRRMLAASPRRIMRARPPVATTRGSQPQSAQDCAPRNPVDKGRCSRK